MVERLKLIRNDSIGNYSWDNKDTTTGAEETYGKNNWPDARLNYLLNGGHDDETIGGSLYWNSESGNCYSGVNNATVPCDFTNTGLKEEAKNMIGDTLWYLGGSNTYDDITASMFYERERGTTVYTGRDTSWIGKVGLMYPSDYGYATSGGSTTNRNTCLNTVLYNWGDISDCYTNDWLYENSFYQWTLLSGASLPARAFRVYTLGYIYFDGTSTAYGIRPVVFLKPNIKIVDGNGSSINPYILSE